MALFAYNIQSGKTIQLTDGMADAISPSWDAAGKYLYFLASTELAQGSGWANTSAMKSDPEYAAYVINLRKEDPTPFTLRSDEEGEEKKNGENGEGEDADQEFGRHPALDYANDLKCIVMWASNPLWTNSDEYKGVDL